MARPRLLSDEQVLRLLAHSLGDADHTWTLTEAAAVTGLHPATLIKRFGSRQGVLVALSRRWVDSIPTAPTTQDVYRELQAWIDSLSPGNATGTQMLTRLDMLLEDLRDPELRPLLHLGWQRTVDYLTALVDHARQDGRMRAGPASETIARLLLDTAHGSLLRAAVTPDPTDADPTHTARILLEALT